MKRSVASQPSSVSLARRVDGQLVDLGQSQEFQLVPIVEPTLEGASPEDVADLTERGAYMLVTRMTLPTRNAINNFVCIFR